MAKTTKTTAAKSKTVAVDAKSSKTSAATADKKAEEKAVAKTSVKTATPAKTACKSATKTTAKTTEKEPTEIKNTTVVEKPEVKSEIFVEFGNAQVSIEKVVEDAKKKYAADGNKDEVKSVKVYLKPEEQTAYYIINDTVSGKMDVFFY